MRRKVTTLSEQVVQCICACDIEELGSLTEEKIAESLGQCRFSMSEKFEVDHKLPISRFILREKMYRSILMLEKRTQIPINELSRKLGFRSVNQFAREFVKFFAIDPWEYRKIKMK
jgi:AraC-like DNA-binding protein